MLNNSLYSSDKSEWATPQFLFDILDYEFHFTLDVCASKENAKCENYYTIEDDGLNKDWSGTIWMNPPYGMEIERWVEKAYNAKCICVCLLPVRSDTYWWYKYVMKALEIRFLNRRLSFGNSKNKAPFPSAIIVFNGQVNIPKLGSVLI